MGSANIQISSPPAASVCLSVCLSRLDSTDLVLNLWLAALSVFDHLSIADLSYVQVQRFTFCSCCFWKPSLVFWNAVTFQSYSKYLVRADMNSGPLVCEVPYVANLYLTEDEVLLMMYTFRAGSGKTAGLWFGSFDPFYDFWLCGCMASISP